MFLYLGPDILINIDKVFSIERKKGDVTIYFDNGTKMHFGDNVDNISLYATICKVLENKNIVIGTTNDG